MNRVERPDEIVMSFEDIQIALKEYIFKHAGVEVGHVIITASDQELRLGLPCPQLIATALIKDPK